MIYSGFFRRAIAFMIDMLLVSIPTSLVFIPLLGVQMMNTSAPGQLSEMQMGLFMLTVFCWQAISLLITWLYFALLESGPHQATWGKRILGIKVVGKEGNRISFGRATGRFFAKTLSYMLANIGFIMAGFTNRKRALHDIIVETCVVKKDFKQGQELPPTKSHKFLLFIVCILWLAFLLGLSALSSALTLTPTQTASRQAALRLGNLATQGSTLQQPVRLDGSTFYRTADGYRAVVVDPETSHKFTLFLKNGSNRVCCQSFPLGDCVTTGFEPCEK